MKLRTGCGHQLSNKASYVNISITSNDSAWLEHFHTLISDWSSTAHRPSSGESFNTKQYERGGRETETETETGKYTEKERERGRECTSLNNQKKYNLSPRDSIPLLKYS